MSFEFNGKAYPGILEFKDQFLKRLAEQIKAPEYALGAERELAELLERTLKECPEQLLKSVNGYVGSIKKEFEHAELLSYSEDKALYLSTLKAVRTLGIKVIPSIYIYSPTAEQLGYIYQAMATGFCGSLNVFYSDIFTKEKMLTMGEKAFIIGHELGHNQCNHMFEHGIGGGGEVSLHLQRLHEYSADRAGLLACGSLNDACSALLKVDFAAEALSHRIESREKVLPDDMTPVWKDYEERVGKHLTDIIESVEETCKTVEPDTGSHPNCYRRLCAMKFFYHSQLYRRLSKTPQSSSDISDIELQSAMNILSTQEA